MATKIKQDEVCAWCGIRMHGVGHQVADDHICMRCYRNHLIDKKHMQSFWNRIKEGINSWDGEITAKG